MVLDLTLHQVPPSPPRGLFDVSKYKYHINISLNAVVRRTTDNPDMTLQVVSHTLGCVGRKNGKPSNGSSGHVGGTSPGQTRKKPKDLSVCEREERGRGEGEGVYVCVCVSE